MEQKILEFLLRAKRLTYAGKGAESPSSRPWSHDLQYAEGDLLYIDTYLGGERFSGEEALWIGGEPVWSMNYSGRVTGGPFSGDFLKEALLRVPEDAPFRGPEEYARDGYVYRCAYTGDPGWFQGRETIEWNGREIYECFFHGGSVR